MKFVPNYLSAAALAVLSLPSLLLAQANATADLMTYGDVLGAPCQARLSGMSPGSMCFLLPSFTNAGSSYLVGQTGDPNDMLAVGIDLAAQGHYFTGVADAAGNLVLNFNVPPIPTMLDRNVWWQGFSRTGGGGVNEWDNFTNIRWINLNKANRWQGAGSNMPIASALIAWAVTERGADGRPVRIFSCGGGPAVLVDVGTPYPCTDLAGEFDLRTGATTQVAAPMTVSRAFHTATALNDGRILVTGGVTYGGQKSNGNYFTKLLDSAEIYDPATGAWTLLPPMANFRAGHSASLLPDGRVLIAAGTEGNNAHELSDVLDLLGTSLKDSELFEPSTNTWSSGPNLPEPKAGHGAITLDDGRILITGGITHVTIFGLPIPDFSNQASVYDPSTNSFSAAGRIGAKRALFTQSLMPDGRVAIFAGAGGDIFNVGPIKQCNLYNPATTSSIALKSLPGNRAFATSVSLGNGFALVIGGADGDLVDPIPQADVWLFDVYNDTITALSPLGQARAGNVCERMEDGTIFAAGGESTTGLAVDTTESLSL